MSFAVDASQAAEVILLGQHLGLNRDSHFGTQHEGEDTGMT
jgi:hypothetical protein